MQQIFLDEIRTHISRNKYKQIFRKFVQFLCCVVVFCTTYALILPAITMEQTAYCGLEEHTHSEECYQELPHQELVCNEDTLQLHNHSESCYDSDANLICGLADYVVHTHAETCFYNGQLVCTLPERGVHVHNDACYIPGETEPEVLHVHTDSCSTQQQGELLCTIEEYEGHAHDAACYAAGDTLECTLAENHVHQESCYTYPLICTLSTDPHIHSADCYGIGEQLCTTEEGHVHGSDCSITSLNCENTEKGHEHNDSCYHTEVICTIPENHFHDSSCYSSVILCGKTEGEFHEHGADCYSMEPQLNCSLAENHFHDDSCYLQELVCTIPEDPGHSHGEDCYQWETVLVCGLEEGQPEPTEPAEPILNCTEPVAQEHIHSENCFVTVGTEPTPKCGITEEDHIHTEDCYVCTIEEHTHTLACYSDPEADVESPAVWEATFAHVALTGDWPTDVVAIAETQIGYTESTRNYEVWEDNSVHGYTRYGAWYGVPYGDWCGMFASFCLDYAGVEGMPYHYGVRPWIEDLASRGLYYSARETKAQKGNLIFFDWEGDGLSDHVGIVAEVQEAQEHAGASIKAIEGNASNCVKYVYYSPDDPVILGYGLLPGQERIPLSVEEPEDTTPDRALEILICGTPAHSHSESCYDSDGALICKKDEHIHTIDCADPSSPVGYAYAGDMMRMLFSARTGSNIDYHTDIEQLFTGVVIYDSQNNVVYSSNDPNLGDKTVTLGEKCRIKLFFSENTSNQFNHGQNVQLTYTIPDNLSSEIVGTGVITNRYGTVVANYSINNNQLTIKPVVPENGENFFGQYNDVSLEIEFDAEVLQSSDSTETTIDFTENYTVTVNVEENGYLNTEKEVLAFDPVTRTISYKCTATAHGGTVRISNISDWEWGIADDKINISYDSLTLIDSDGNDIKNLWNISIGENNTIWMAPYQPFYLNHNESITMTYQVKIDNSVTTNFEHTNVFAVSGNNGKEDVYLEEQITTPIQFTNVKKNGTFVPEGVNGVIQDALEWTVEIDNHQLQKITITDQLSERQTFCHHKPLNIKATKQDGTKDYIDVVWTNIQTNETNTQFEYSLPEGYVEYELTYYSHYEFDESGDAFQYFENTVTTNISIGDTPTSGTGSVGVLGVPPGIDKTITASDDDWITFKIDCFMPGALYNQSNVLLYDTLASWGATDGYIQQEPDSLTVTITPDGGAAYNLQPYTGQGSTDNTYLLDKDGQSFTMYFNTSQAEASSSIWNCNVDSTLTISYRASLDSPMLDSWGGEPKSETLREFLEKTNQKVYNEAELTYSPTDNISDSVSWTPPAEPLPDLRKTATATESDGVYNYSVWFSSGTDESCIFRQEMEADGDTINDVQTFVLEDAFDSDMEYVEGSLQLSIWGYWNHTELVQRYKFADNAAPSFATRDGKQVMTVSAQDLIGFEGPEKSNWLTNNNLLFAFKYLTGGYQYEFTYQLRVKESVKMTTTEGVLELDNEANIRWTDSEGPKTVDPAQAQVKYDTGVLQKGMETTENSNIVTFSILVNHNALDLAEGGDTYVLYDTMSSNLAFLYNTLVVETLDKESGEVTRTLTPAECNFAYNPDENKMTFILPDKVVIRLHYSCRVNGVSGETTEISNLVELQGRSIIQDIVNTEFRIDDHQGSADGSSRSFYLQKQDGNNHNVLSGVTFHLYGDIKSDDTKPPLNINGKELYFYASHTTGPDGIAKMDDTQLTSGHLYALVEDSPPSGYVALSEPYLFYMDQRPAGVSMEIDVIAEGELFVIENFPIPTYELPATGGTGYELYTVGGTLLMLAALILLYNQKKCRKEDYRSS